MIWMLMKLSGKFFEVSSAPASFATADRTLQEYFGAARFTRESREQSVSYSGLIPFPQNFEQLSSFRMQFTVAYNYLPNQSMCEEYIKWIQTLDLV